VVHTSSLIRPAGLSAKHGSVGQPRRFLLGTPAYSPLGPSGVMVFLYRSKNRSAAFPGPGSLSAWFIGQVLSAGCESRRVVCTQEWRYVRGW